MSGERETLIVGQYSKISISCSPDIDMVWWHIESTVDDEEITLRDQDFYDLKNLMSHLDDNHFKKAIFKLSAKIRGKIK